MISIKKNHFHKKNIYIDFDLDDMKNINRDSFKAISEENHAPLQMMIDGDDTKKKDFIEENGFNRVRTCYGMSVRRDDLIRKETAKINLLLVKEGVEKYFELAKIYFEYYKKTHESINSLSVDFDEFKNILTKDVYYNDEDGIALAFVEDNEIAYVYASDLAKADEFFYCLCEKLFNDYEEIFFEADDVDASAMRLKNIFIGGVDEITETWIYKLNDK
ncbi:MAG: hypothetical protein PUG50_04985 [Eubacteriales bacterium]|uniref:hypothetical protein n=1 Tax=Fenollaria sp. TaxID=1965292 RepID=UPI002A7639BD|nr:hypothetical protein [Fenollaria sp.]MDD7339916.1 hypothetical protein [Eubacteriales bacterium]MDY3105645.1 hypothetical protein [Fenollaria sp.]